MYKQKSEIISQIQSYHKEVGRLYFEIYERIEDEKMKNIIHDLYLHEEKREKYLEKHKNVAKAINCWLDFPCEKLTNQMNECLNIVKIGSDVKMEDLIKLELHFDNCLIKIYNILASESEMNETVINVFYYMLKKTKKEEKVFAQMLQNSGYNISNGFAGLYI